MTLIGLNPIEGEQRKTKVWESPSSNKGLRMKNCPMAGEEEDAPNFFSFYITTSILPYMIFPSFYSSSFFFKMLFNNILVQEAKSMLLNLDNAEFKYMSCM